MRHRVQAPDEKRINGWFQTGRGATRKQYSAEEKIRIVLDVLRGENSIAELCRREDIAQREVNRQLLESSRNRLDERFAT